ncbi:putative ADP-ribosylation factor GTPase-activating protein AGD15 [Apium graveolens]|uniref:putative ADP-ribosylation factor GTPase-activating protein AGD15 n=1 Tax=Apium graveolens TaxID=4045 RepID=UPI003D7A93F4
MSEKASVSKELNLKHTKILDGLLKLPENKECADCRSRAPRWASVNLGIFICMQCSGIHRSLGVHISKVRSATLDTWLPEQIAFMQYMGNGKANSYWEAELPQNYERGDY